MDCAACQRLEAEFARLEHIHAETRRVMEADRYRVHRRDYAVLQGTESDARLALEIARAELYRHKRDQHGTR